MKELFLLLSILIEINKFLFLKRQTKKITRKVNNIYALTKLNKLRPTIYFSTSVKEQLKYIFGKTRLSYKIDRHKYLKTKKDFVDLFFAKFIMFSGF